MKTISIHRSPLGLAPFFLLAKLFILLSVLNLVACGGGDGSGDPPPPTGTIIDLNSTLSSYEVVPAVDSSLTGDASFSLNDATGALSGSLILSDASDVISAHIHLGALGATGPIAVTLEKDATDPNQYNVPAGTALSAANLDAMQNEGTYVQVHTNAAPGGEVRGQVLLESTDFVRLRVELNGVQSVPAVRTPGTGSAVVYVNTATGVIGGGLHLRNLRGTPSAGHIHFGAVGSNDNIAATLVRDAVDTNAFNIAAGAQLDSTALSELLNENTYFNIHTSAFGTGEVRGQILTRDTSTVVTSVLNGTNVVPAVESTGNASAQLLLNTSTREVSGSLNITSLSSNVSDVHLHIGNAGLNGPILITLVADATNAGRYHVPAATILPVDDFNAVLNEGTYFQIHTSAVGTGELRGQVLADNDNVVLTSVLDGDSVIPAVTTTASASAILLVNQLTGALSGSLTLTNLTNNPTAVHVHIGNVAKNGPIAVTLEQDPVNTNQFHIPDGTILSLANRTRLINSGMYTQVHTDALPNGELRGQIFAQLATDEFSSVLSGDQVATPVVTTGYGNANLFVNTFTGGISGVLEVNDLVGASTAVHVHSGAVGIAGPIVITLEQDTVNSNLFHIPDTTVLNRDDLVDLLSEETYLQVHTDAVATGEIRGQNVSQNSFTVLTSSLDGGRVVDPVVTTATAQATLLVDGNTGDLSGSLITNGISSTVAAVHIHTGAIGVNGPIVVLLEAVSGTTDQFVIPNGTTLAAGDLINLLNSDTYLQVHTTDFPAGEVRGQVIPVLTN